MRDNFPLPFTPPDPKTADAAKTANFTQPEEPAAAAEERSFEVETPWHGRRLDAFLAEKLAADGISRQRIKQLILEGKVSVAGLQAALPRQGLLSGQNVRLCLPAAGESSLKPQEGNLSIIYHDPDFLVLDKPPQLTVHPCPSCPADTLVNILLHHFPQLTAIPGLRPGIVHRLDKDTSGLLVAALNETTRLQLSAAFASRKVNKEYLALVMGRPQPQAGSLNQPIGRHPTLKTKMAVVPGGKEAHSEYRTLFSGSGPLPGMEFSLLAVKIHTGRTHQIRVHLSDSGHPIWGDSLYGGAEAVKLRKSELQQSSYRAQAGNGAGKAGAIPPEGGSGQRKTDQSGQLRIAGRQMLHAWKLEFSHPKNGKPLRFQSELPPDFMHSLHLLLSKPLQVVLTGLPGCGKSALLGALEDLGVPIWSADATVNSLYQPEHDGWLLLKNWYGERFMDPCGNLDKKKLFTAMQTQPGLRREIEGLIHPLVRYALEKFWAEGAALALETGEAAMAAEIPLFLEACFERTGPARSAGRTLETLFLKHLAGAERNRAEGSVPGSLIHLNKDARSDPDAGAETGTGTHYELPRPLLVYVHTPSELRWQRLERRGTAKDKAAVLDSWHWAEAEKKRACDLVVDNTGSLEQLHTAAQELKAMLATLQQEESRKKLACLLNSLQG